jgi:type VI secretion system protein ImpA
MPLPGTLSPVEQPETNRSPTAASPEVLEFVKLLAPISADKPAGVDLRADTSPTSLYYAIRDARTAARLAERPMERGEVDSKNPPPDWRPVLQHATKAVAEKSKDLEITAYLIESLVRLHGLAGLRDGLRLARELAERFWDGLYPLPDQDGVVTRISPLIGLNGEEADGALLAPIGRVPITEASSVGRFTCVDYHDAVALKKLDPKARDAKIANGAVTLENLQKAVAESSPAFYQTLVEDLNQCLAQLAQLGAAYDQRCEGQGPPTSAIRTALESCLDIIKSVAQNKLEVAVKVEPSGKAAGGKAAGGSASANGAAGSSDRPRTREDAFRDLLEIADFFRRTEPHTVVSYALEQIVRWGRMSLPELLAELIPEEPSRKNLFKQVGIKSPEPPGKGDSAKESKK